MFLVEGGHRLSGTITPAGNKNAALPILAATLLTDEPVTLRNLPRIGDVEVLLALLASLGVEIVEDGPREITVRARDITTTALDPRLCRQIRASILLAGPMVSRCGRVQLAPPGGDSIGRRRVDTHFLALQALGATVEVNGAFEVRSPALRAAEIFLDEASVTATENALMAAVRAPGRTTIANAASEPHVQDLCHFLNGLGARVGGVGTNTLTIDGVERLHGGAYTIGPDHIEVGSFIGLAAATRGEITIRDAVPEHMTMTALVFRRLGVAVEVRGRDIFVPGEQALTVQDDLQGAIPKIDDGPWPAFPADLTSIAVVLATQARGTVLIFEKMFESRFFFVDKLVQMGARIVLCDPHRVVVAGPSALHGETLSSPDIRAGMALLTAALAARGTSEMHNVEQIDRGYERLDERLQALGARIERVGGQVFAGSAVPG
ncbi:MAG TPA: UDP-N-acetylglucosamine 1-carboxyvinyltransferase [Thermomicrobiales bacterium]|nr:UDP-N-acetylglucosamine 1-carboxyvinyltransferase [Thermomicrobiales bacterium]